MPPRRLGILVLLVATASLAAASCTRSSGTAGSGVPGDVYLDEMTGAERATFCQWWIGRMGGGGAHTCDWGTVTIMTDEQCEAHPWPHCLASLAEACAATLSGACDRGESPQCQDYADCRKDDGRRYHPDYSAVPEDGPVPMALAEKLCVLESACSGGAAQLGDCIAEVAYRHAHGAKDDPSTRLKLGCAAQAAGCDSYLRCVSRNHAWPYCEAHPGESCDGALAVRCDGTGGRAAVGATDCALTGQVCESGACAAPSQECSEPAGTTSCRDGDLHRCDPGGKDVVVPCPAVEPCIELGGGQKACASSGPECTPGAERRCEGTSVVECRPYPSANREVRIDCARVEGMTCGGEDAFCAPASAECDPATDPQACDGALLAGCWAGERRSIDCAGLGFASCASEGAGVPAFCR